MEAVVPSKCSQPSTGLWHYILEETVFVVVKQYKNQVIECSCSCARIGRCVLLHVSRAETDDVEHAVQVTISSNLRILS